MVDSRPAGLECFACVVAADFFFRVRHELAVDRDIVHRTLRVARRHVLKVLERFAVRILDRDVRVRGRPQEEEDHADHEIQAERR